KEDLERIFQLHGKYSVAAFAIQRDKHHLLVANRQGLVAFASRGSIALACGDPLVSDDLFVDAVGDYVRHCERHGWKPCIYFAAEERLSAYHALKFQSLGVAEEAVVNLQSFAPENQMGALDIVHRYARSLDPAPH